MRDDGRWDVDLHTHTDASDGKATIEEMLNAAEEREYDYFFSSHFLMILTDFFGLGVIGFVVWLEKKGVIARYGVQEDASR